MANKKKKSFISRRVIDTKIPANEDQDSKSEEEELDLSLEDQIKSLVEGLIQKENDNQMLVTEKKDLLTKITSLERDLGDEKVKFSGLEKRLEDQLRNIKMLSKGTKDLDKILTAQDPDVGRDC